MKNSIRKILAMCITLLMLVTLLSGCGGKFTLEKAIKQYQNYGVDISTQQKPYYKLIGAKDGVMFYMGGDVVKLYEFNSEAAYQKGLKILKEMKKYPKRDLVVLETNSKAAKEVFLQGTNK